MGLVSLLTAIFFGALALGLSVVVAWLMIEPLLMMARQRKGKGPVKKTETALARIDALLEEEKISEALKLLKKTLSFDTPLDVDGVRRLKESNQAVLARVLILAEENPNASRIASEVEHLLLERVELSLLFAKAHESFQNIRFRREKAGKDLPSWSKTDFDTRIKEIKSELQANQKKLAAALEALFSACTEVGAKDEPITYH